MSQEKSILDGEVRVVNMGIERFFEDLKENEVPVIQMDWRPPAGGDKRLIELLDRLAD